MTVSRTIHDNNIVACTILFAAAVLIISGLAGIISFRSLYADGAGFFSRELGLSGFAHVNKTRVAAEWINQFFIVALLKWGINMPLHRLAWLHGFSLYYFPIAALVASLWFSRGSLPLLIGTIVYIVLVWFQSNFFLIGEAHVFGAAAWLFLVLLLSGEYSRNRAVLCALPVISLVISFSYEGVLFYAPVIAFILMRKILDEPRYRYVFMLTLPVFLCGFICALFSVLHPRDPLSYGGFKNDLFMVLKSWYLLMVVVYNIMCFSICFLPLQRTVKIILAVSFVLLLAYVIAVLFTIGIPVEKHYQNRVLISVYMPLLLVPVIYAWQKFRWLPGISPPRVFLFTVLTVGVMAAGDMVSSVSFSRYIDSFCAVMHEKKSLSGIEGRFRWGWPDPILNALLADEPEAPLLPEMELQLEKDGWTKEYIAGIREYRTRHAAPGICSRCRRE
jgi:hypothetical protein